MSSGSLLPGGPEASRRRSQRVILSLRVIVRTDDGPKATSFEEETHTLIVNAHGALIALKSKVVKGQKLRLTNRATKAEQACRVASLGPTAEGKAQTNLYRMTGDSDPAPPDVTAVRVVPGTRDAISFLFNLRAADWQRIPELRIPVFDGRRLYDVVARIDTPQGTITVPAGNFPAFRVALRLFDHGKELTDTRFWLWITKDEAHTPVLVEAEIPFGTARIELTHLP